MKPESHVIENPWKKLRAYTDARIGLGRTGASLPTHELLAFQLAHARAQDAVHLPLDSQTLSDQLSVVTASTPLILHSQASDRAEYLQRPDLGRRLNEPSAARLTHCNQTQAEAYDLAVVIVDGLSSFAVQKNAIPMIQALQKKLQADAQAWTLGPFTLVEQGRVAIGDDIGQLLNANAVVVMIGERPGLSSPDSLGLYLTWKPTTGNTDAQRNCISNVRPEGLSYPEAANRLHYLLSESRRLKLSGVNLKDRTETAELSSQNSAVNFLVNHN